MHETDAPWPGIGPRRSCSAVLSRAHWPHLSPAKWNINRNIWPIQPFDIRFMIVPKINDMHSRVAFRQRMWSLELHSSWGADHFFQSRRCITELLSETMQSGKKGLHDRKDLSICKYKHAEKDTSSNLTIHCRWQCTTVVLPLKHDVQNPS